MTKLKVNIFDETFRHTSCSTAWKESQQIEYVRDMLFWHGPSVFVDGYTSHPVISQVRCAHKIGWLHEPPCLYPHVYEAASCPPAELDFILTYDRTLLDGPEADRFRFCPYGGIWIERHRWGMRRKTKLVSMLYGNKMATEGHRLRHDVAKLIARVPGLDFYGFQGTPVDYSATSKYRVHKDYMFSVVIETCRSDYLFTEILLDCFAVGTVPIFWGCPSIGSFFDERGILSFSTADEAAAIVSELSRGLYEKLLPAARANFELAKQYEIAEDWMVANGVFNL